MPALLLGALLFLCAASPVLSGEILTVGGFSSASPGTTLPEHWEPLLFEKIPAHTRYTLVKDEGITVVKAESRAAASGLIRRILIDPGKYPVIRWRWKISNVINGSDPRRKVGDDYPARLYITFAYDPARLDFLERLKFQAARALYGNIPGAAINYIWATETPVGTWTDNAYTAYTRMYVVESGRGRIGEWIVEERNILQDYIQAFGRRPPLINGVAIMTDTDNTGEQATAYYGDIVFMQSTRGAD